MPLRKAHRTRGDVYGDNGNNDGYDDEMDVIVFQCDPTVPETHDGIDDHYADLNSLQQGRDHSQNLRSSVPDEITVGAPGDRTTKHRRGDRGGSGRGGGNNVVFMDANVHHVEMAKKMSTSAPSHNNNNDVIFCSEASSYGESMGDTYESLLDCISSRGGGDETHTTLTFHSLVRTYPLLSICLFILFVLVSLALAAVVTLYVRRARAAASSSALAMASFNAGTGVPTTSPAEIYVFIAPSSTSVVEDLIQSVEHTVGDGLSGLNMHGSSERPSAAPITQSSSNEKQQQQQKPQSQQQKPQQQQQQQMPQQQQLMQQQLQMQEEPTDRPSTHPTGSPSENPTVHPSGGSPSHEPTFLPTWRPSKGPSASPSDAPSFAHSILPTTFSHLPSDVPTSNPSATPSTRPSRRPTSLPSSRPTNQPSASPSSTPTDQPSLYPSSMPTGYPTSRPSNSPTVAPTRRPSNHPTVPPTRRPSVKPTHQPSSSPSSSPTDLPTVHPSHGPSSTPTRSITPSLTPSNLPTVDYRKLYQNEILDESLVSEMMGILGRPEGGKLPKHVELEYQTETLIGTSVYILTDWGRRRTVVAFQEKSQNVDNFLFTFQRRTSEFGPSGGTIPEAGSGLHWALNADAFSNDLYYEVSTELWGLLQLRPKFRLVFCGFSKGGAAALLMGAYLAYQVPTIPLRVITYGAPRVGDHTFRTFVRSLDNMALWNVVYGNDMFARLPWDRNDDDPHYTSVGHLLQLSAPNVVRAYFQHSGNCTKGYVGVPPRWHQDQANSLADHDVERYTDFFMRLLSTVRPNGQQNPDTRPLVEGFETGTEPCSDE